MRKVLRRHLNLTNQLFLPICIVLVGLSFFYKNYPPIQLNLLLLTAFLYLGFSFVHHFLDKSLTLEVVIEYILIAWLVIILLIGTLG